jgi:hypothetical protein
MERVQRTSQDLTLAAGHIIFELKALVDDAAWLLSDDERFVDAFSTPLLEAMLLHLRNLWEFLFNTGPNGRSLAAVDFLPSWDAEEAFASTQLLRSIQGVLNNHLSHLSWERIQDRTGMPAWDWRMPVVQVVTAFNRFVQQLPDGLRKHFIAEASRSVERTAAFPSAHDRRWAATTTPEPVITIIAIEPPE